MSDSIVNLETLLEIWHKAGWLGLAGALLTLTVRMLAGPTLQSLLGAVAPGWALWGNWPDWVRRIVMFTLAASGGILTAVTGGMSWPAALTAIIPVAFMAHILHSATQWDSAKTTASTENAIAAAQTAIDRKKSPMNL